MKKNLFKDAKYKNNINNPKIFRKNLSWLNESSINKLNDKLPNIKDNTVKSLNNVTLNQDSNVSANNLLKNMASSNRNNDRKGNIYIQKTNKYSYSNFFHEGIKLNFSQLEVPKINYYEYKAKIKRYRQELRNTNDAQKAARICINLLELSKNIDYLKNFKIIKEFNFELNGNCDELKICLTHHQSNEIKTLREKTLFIIFEKNWYKELVNVLGKFYLLELNTKFFRYELENEQILQKIKCQEENIINTLESTLNDYNHRSTLFVEKNEKLDNLLQDYVDLIICRKKFVLENFDLPYVEFILKQQINLNLNYNFINTYVSNIKKYLLPIHINIMENLDTKFSNEADLMKSNFYQKMSIEELRNYYKKVFQDNDWEMRNYDSIIESIKLNQAQQTFFPACRNFIYSNNFDSLIDDIFEIGDRVVDRNYRGFMKQLLNSGYIQIVDTSEGNLPLLFNLSVEYKQLPIVFGRANKSILFIRQLLAQSGITYAKLIRNKSLSRSHKIVDISKESQNLVALSYELMAMSRSNILYKEDSKLFFVERVQEILLDIIKESMVFEFQLRLYKVYNEFEISKKYNIDGPIDDLLASIYDIWKSMINEYRLEYEYSEYSLDLEQLKDLINKPFYNIVEVLIYISALTILFDFIDNRRLARVNFEKFCALSAEDNFIEILKLANIASPLEKDTIKTLAYKLSKLIDES